MRKWSKSIGLAALMQACAWAGVQVEFPKGSYTIREVIERVEHETPYQIQLPFADRANARKVLPTSMDVEEVFRWIARYYEDSNQIPLYYEKDGSRVTFQKSIKTRRADFEKMLERPLVLKGRKWSIKDSIPTVVEQMGISIDLPFVDRAQLEADYDYECTFGEWIEEVRRYWEHHNGLHLGIRMDDAALTFVEEGQAQGHLDIALMGKISVDQRKKKARPMPAQKLPSQLLLSDGHIEEELPTRKAELRGAPVAVVKKESSTSKKTVAAVKEAPSSELAKAEPSQKSKAESTDVTSAKSELAKSEASRRELARPDAMAKSEHQVKPFPITQMSDRAEVNEEIPQAKPWQPLDRWVEEEQKIEAAKPDPKKRLLAWASSVPRAWMSDRGRWEWMTALIQPHPQATSVQALVDWVKPHLSEGRGQRQWLQKAEDIDLSSLGAYERKKALREAEEVWLKMCLETLEAEPAPRAADRGWHRRYAVGIGFGNNAQLQGPHPLRPSQGDSAQWIENHLETEYRYNPLGPWKFVYGLRVDHLIASGAAKRDLSWSGLGVHMVSTRTVAHSGIEALSPYFDLQHFDDVFVGTGTLEGKLWQLGTSLHWRPSVMKGRFKKNIGTTDVFLEQWRPENISDRHFLSSQSLRQESFGLRHRQSWLGSDKAGVFGPSLEVYLVHREGDAPEVKGLEMGGELKWQMQTEKWDSQVSFSYLNWDRSSSVQEMELGFITYYKALRKGRCYIEAVWSNSSSRDVILDSDGSLLKLGWEVQW